MATNSVKKRDLNANSRWGLLWGLILSACGGGGSGNNRPVTSNEQPVTSNDPPADRIEPSSHLNTWLSSQQSSRGQNSQSEHDVSMTLGRNPKTPIQKMPTFAGEPIEVTVTSNKPLAAGERIEVWWYMNNKDNVGVGTTFTPTKPDLYWFYVYKLSGTEPRSPLNLGEELSFRQFKVRQKPAVENSEIPIPEANTHKAILFSIHENHPGNKIIVNLADTTDDSSFHMGSSPDNRFFSVDSKTGAISFKPNDSYQLLDYEKPQGFGKNNIYDLQIIHRNGGADTIINISITVRNLQNEKTIQKDFDKASLPDIAYSNYDTPIIPGQPSFNELTNNCDEKNIEYNILSRGYNAPFKMPETGPLIITYSIVNAESILSDALLNRVVTVKTEDPAISQVKVGTLINRFTDATDMKSMRMLTRDALDEFEKVANLKFEEVADNQYVTGNLRIVIISKYRPDMMIEMASYNAGPFVVLNSATSVKLQNIYPTKQLMLHEIGHFMKLFHPFISNHDPYYKTPKTVISYYVSYSAEAGLQPADIAALQFMYGLPENQDEGINALDGTPAIII